MTQPSDFFYDETPMTREEYRRWMKTLGISVDGNDVCHIISKANKGADAKANYFMCGSSFNRTIGNRGDALNCYLVGLEKCAAAVAVSRSLRGYDGPDAQELYEQGRTAFMRIRSEVLAEVRRSERRQNRNFSQPPTTPSSVNQYEQASTTSAEPSQNGTEMPSAAIPETNQQLINELTQEEDKICRAIIKTGRRKGEQCGRVRPCVYHDKPVTMGCTIV